MKSIVQIYITRINSTLQAKLLIWNSMSDWVIEVLQMAYEQGINDDILFLQIPDCLTSWVDFDIIFALHLLSKEI